LEYNPILKKTLQWLNVWVNGDKGREEKAGERGWLEREETGLSVVKDKQHQAKLALNGIIKAYKILATLACRHLNIVLL